MSEITYKEIRVHSGLTKLKRKIPYGWDLNIYRGCQHSCQYCYAIYSHKYLEPSKEFFRDIYIKTNIVDELEKELMKPSWKKEVINIGGVTDSYQEAEEKYQLMPQILKLLIKYETPAIISTKSNLILRDYDLIDQLSRITYINVAETITTVDEDIREKIEPGSSRVEERFKVLREFRKTNASIGLHVMPIIPYITDDEKNFDEMFATARDCGVDYVLTGTLYLRGSTRSHFLNFVENEFPAVYDKLKVLYKTGGAGKEYKNSLYVVVNRLRDKYGLSSSYMKPMREKLRK
jgi:DNA repair photolyase